MGKTARGTHADLAGGIAGDDRVRSNSAGDDGGCPDDTTFAQNNPGHNKTSRADESSAADPDGCSLQREYWRREVVGARAKIGFLRDGRVRADLNHVERVRVRAISQASAMVHD